MQPDEQRGRVSASGYRSHTYYIQNAAHERLKAAWWALVNKEGAQQRSLSALVEALILEEAERLEVEHNNGEPFDPAPQRARIVDPEGVRRQAETASEYMRSVRSREQNAQHRKDSH